VLEYIGQPMRIGNHEIKVTPSIGISRYSEHDIEFKSLINAADLAMNQAKQSHQANYVFYSRDLERNADMATGLEQRLRHALKQGGLVVHYQPVIDIRNGRIIAAEALVRLIGDEGETIAPLRFIRVAESLGLIGELDDWVVSMACHQHGEWLKQGLQPITIAVNASPVEFKNHDYAERIVGIITDTGIDPAHFLFELTENTLQTRTYEVIASLTRLKELGVRVAVDEFGCGDTDLNLMTRLPIDLLKIDPTFVQHIEHDETSLAVARSIIDLGHHLSLEVVGEGIESTATFHHLRESGCNWAQGFLVSRPLPAEEFAHWCHNYMH